MRKQVYISADYSERLTAGRVEAIKQTLPDAIL